MTSAVSGSRGHFRIILSAVLIVCAFTGGIFFSGFNKPSFAPALIAPVLIAILALWPGFKKGWSFAAAPAAGLLAAFWAWIGLSLTWTQVPHVSMVFFATFTTLPLLFFALTQSPRADDFIRACQIALLVPLTLLAGWAVIQFIFLADLLTDRVHHPMLNANNLAETLMMGLFFVLPFFVRGRGLGKLICGLLIVLYIFAILTTQSRGGTLGIIVGGVVFLIVCNATVRQQWKSFLMLFIALGLAAAAYHHLILQRFQDIHLFGGADAADSVMVRTYLWSAGWEMFKASPFGGVGLGTFYLTFPWFRLKGDISDGFFLHVDPVQFAIETGIPAMILFYAFATAVMVRTINALRSEDADQSTSVALMCAFCGLLGLLINAHLDYPLYMVTAQIMAAVFLASWYRASEDAIDTPRFNLTLRNRAHAAFIIPLFMIVLIAVPVWIARAGVGVYFDGQTGQAINAHDPAAAARAAGLMRKFAPASYDRMYMVSGVTKSQQLKDSFASLTPEERTALYQSAENDFALALKYNPFNVAAINQRAVFYFSAYPQMNADGLVKARELLEKAVATDPSGLQQRMALAKMYQDEGRAADGVRVMMDGLSYVVAERFAPPQYFYVLAEVREANGDMLGAAYAINLAQKREAIYGDMAQRDKGIGQWVDRQMNDLESNLSGLLER